MESRHAPRTPSDPQRIEPTISKVEKLTLSRSSARPAVTLFEIKSRQHCCFNIKHRMNPNMKRTKSHYAKISRMGVRARLANKKPRNLKGFIRDRIAKDENGCWIWQRYIHPSGYGYTTIHGEGMISAPRLSFRAFKGDIPKGIHVCHTCDVRACCNPAHLFLGTQQENNSDRDKKGRQAISVKIRTTKLTPKQIVAIRAEYAEGKTKTAIGKRFAVSAKNIEAIVNRKTWKHIP